MRPEITAEYLGLQLSSPIVVGACPISLRPESVRELAIAGAGAVVLPSLFEEQIVHYMLDNDMPAEEDEATAEQRGYRESSDRYNGGPVAYLKAIGNLKQVTSVPILANLSGCTRGNWLRFAGDIESSGADALELSLRLDTSDPSLGSQQVEEKFLECVRTVCDAVAIPVSVKLSPYFTCLTNLAWRLVEAGVSGLVIFGREARFEVQLDRLHATTRWELTPSSHISETIAGLMRVRAGGPDISVAASGGICSASDANKTIIAGADVAMITSEIYREGPEVVAHIIDGMISFLERNGIESFSQLVRSRPKPTPLTLGRSDYLQPLTERTAYEDPRREVPPRTGDRWGHLIG
jgi:dihydroorotate dehydrogenase (fumarate)